MISSPSRIRFLSVPLIVAAVLVASVSGDLVAAEEAAGAAEPFDWRAFLAPFHAVVLHLPIGFLSIAFILEFYSFFQKGYSLRRGIGIVMLASAASAIVATLFGIFRASGGGYEETALELHRWTGIAVTALIFLLGIFHRIAFPSEWVTRRFFAGLYRLGLIVGVGMLGVAGHFGGNLTHGSKYLFENAPDWVQEWAETADAKIAEAITGEEVEGGGETAEGGGTGIYAEILRPAFEEKCIQCHGPEKQKGDYRMDTVEGLFAAGESEIDPIVPGRPLESYLVELVTLPESDDYVMPPEGKEPLTPEETLALVRWIWDGAETGVEKKEAGAKTGEP